MKKPKKVSFLPTFLIFLVIGILLLLRGFEYFMEKKVLEETWKKVTATITLTNYEDNQETIVKYYIMDEKYEVKLDDYEPRDYKDKQITLYVNINNHYETRRSIGNDLAIQVYFAIGSLFTILSFGYIGYKVVKDIEKKRIMKKGEHHRIEISATRFEYKIKFHKSHPEYALLELQDDDQILKYKSDRYMKLGEYIEKTRQTQADLYIDPMDNRKYAIVFDFEKK